MSCVCGVGGPIPVVLFPPLSGVSGGLPCLALLFLLVPGVVGGLDPWLLHPPLPSVGCGFDLELCTTSPVPLGPATLLLHAVGLAPPILLHEALSTPALLDFGCRSFVSGSWILPNQGLNTLA